MWQTTVNTHTGIKNKLIINIIICCLHDRWSVKLCFMICIFFTYQTDTRCYHNMIFSSIYKGKRNSSLIVWMCVTHAYMMCMNICVCSCTRAVRQGTTPVSIQLTGEWWVSNELSISGTGIADRRAKGKLLSTHDCVGRRTRVATVHFYMTDSQERICRIRIRHIKALDKFIHHIVAGVAMTVSTICTVKENTEKFSILFSD